MKVDVAAHCECGHNFNFTILPDEFCHDSMRVDFYVCISLVYALWELFSWCTEYLLLLLLHT